MFIEKAKCFIPTKIEDLSKFVLIGREKLVSVRAEIRAIDKLDLAKDVREQKKEEANNLADALLDAETRIGELLKEIPKAQGKRNDLELSCHAGTKLKEDQANEMGFSRKQVSQFQKLADNKDIVEQVKAEAKENDDLPTRTEVLRKIKEKEKENEIKELRKIVQKQPPVEVIEFLSKNAEGTYYDVMKKILQSENLYFLIREIIIRDEYANLLNGYKTGLEAMNILAVKYYLSADSIKKIIYD